MTVPLCLLVAMAGSAIADDSKELARFDGTWAIASRTMDGTAQAADQIKGRTMVIKSGNLTLVFAGKELAGGTFKLVDAASTPAQIDWELKDTPAKGKTLKGIYKSEGDKIVLCFGGVGKDRPTAFECKKGSGAALMEIKKAEADK